jgi:replicative superfamily II helicase
VRLNGLINAPLIKAPRFDRGLLDSLNAEISLGTVTNVPEGAEWIGYTYMFVRMRKNPMVYGTLAQRDRTPCLTFHEV